MRSVRVLVVLSLLSLLLMPTVVLAQQTPTQQFNKIFLNPFYRESLSQNTNYEYVVEVTPPDKISKVNNAIITFRVWMNPTITFFLTVNGELCNTQEFFVSTSFANAGIGEITFDCSNVITKSGTYDVVLSTDDPTGTITGWLDLTYMNNPPGDLEVHGTEYAPGDEATVFLQLVDSQGLAENNGACFVTIYEPLGTNATHNPLISNAPMINLNNGDGMYYYDLIAPDDFGVYMVSARCSYEHSGGFVYEPEPTETESPNRTVLTGSYSGSTLVLNDFTDGIYTSCNSANAGGTQTCSANYTFDTKIHFLNQTNFTNINLFYMGEASKEVIISFEVWNYTSGSWITLPNSITLAGTSATPIGIGEFVSNSLPTEDILSTNGLIKIKSTGTFGSSFTLYDNWLSIELQNAEGDVVSVKGSSELNVQDRLRNQSLLIQQVSNATWHYPNRSLTNFNFTVNAEINNTAVAEAVWSWNGLISANVLSQIAQAVWEYTSRNLTFYEDVTDYDKIQAMVWNATDRNLTYYEDFGDQTNYSLIESIVSSYANNITPEDVWSYTNRSLTTFFFDVVNETLIAENVWDYGERNLTFYEVNNITSEDVWSYANRNLTFTEDVFNYSLLNDYVNTILFDINEVDSEVWSFTARNLTYYEDVFNYSLLNDYFNTVLFDINELPSEVWNYNDRNLTYYEVTEVNESSIALTVWAFNNRTLTYYEVNNITAQDIWEYSNRNLTYYEDFGDQTNYSLIESLISDYANNLSAQDIWTFANRNLTYYENFGDLTNYTLINELIQASANNITPEEIWAYTNRSLTLYEDVTDYDKIQAMVWNATVRNLTFYEVNNITAQDIWTFTARNLTYYEDFGDQTNYSLIESLIQDYANNLTAEQIWKFSERNLTYYEDFGDQTNYELIQDLVWNATERTLTNFNFTVSVNQSLIADAVWDATTRTLTETQDVTNYSLIQDIIEGFANNLSAQDIWEYSNRNLTYYENFGDQTNYSLIAQVVWEYTDRSLTDFNFTVSVDTNLIASDVWNYVERNLTSFDFDVVNESEIAIAVWDAVNRSLTDFNFTVEVNEELIAESVWEYTSRNLTFTEDSTDYDLIQALVWNATTRTLTDFNFTVSVDTNAIASDVWNYVERNLTYYEDFGDQTNYSLVQEVVWEATNRSLTSFDFLVDINETLVANAVWTATNRELTAFGFTVDVDENAISDAVWDATVRTLTFYPTTNLTLSNESIQALGEAVWMYEGNISTNLITTLGDYTACVLENTFRPENDWGVTIRTCA